jgi:hypothetical protein
MKMERALNGCMAKDGSEIDGREFTCVNMGELVKVLEEARKRKWQVHLNYIEDGDDLDLWITVE